MTKNPHAHVTTDLLSQVAELPAFSLSAENGHFGRSQHFCRCELRGARRMHGQVRDDRSDGLVDPGAVCSHVSLLSQMCRASAFVMPTFMKNM